MSETEITKELIITSLSNETNIALLEDSKLVEIHREKSTDQFSVGDVYLGKVKKIMPGLNAAFVNIGHEKDAFLHYLDLGVNFLTVSDFVNQAITNNKKSISRITYAPEVPKSGKISTFLSSGQQILVQIAKEAISTKGPRITTEISFAGRYLVLVPFMDKISISQKIKSSEERKRLKSLVQGLRPKNFGIIIRTIAQNKKVEDLTEDLQQLIERWNNSINKLHNASAPSKIASEVDKTTMLIRDLINDSFHAIHIDNYALYKEVRSYVKTISPNNIDIVKYYNEKSPIFDNFGITKQIKSLFGKIVTIKNGIYLIVEHTEAMHVIDVNSGNRVKSDQTQEENALSVNIDSAAEIARQLRLRDMGGIIAIDFIDLHTPQNKVELYKKMNEFMKNDKAKHTILPLNKFGIILITRQRVRQATIIEVTEQCPSCMGTGKIKSSSLIEDEIENTLEFLFEKQSEDKITIAVHPYIYAFLTHGWFSKRWKWLFKYKKWVNIISQSGYHLLEYKFFNKNMEEIVLWNYPNSPIE